ncbi:MAG: dienelactone hydrolase family protein, partial [Hymenobacteraceae bacterium]|nr:dienelactone hydrolase family protein [Hymenobacteraceae bacterium]MDX5395407.1 dienelactone hydrolase family protein [Hymenobacteraceae bacterium]MDX5511456.1 dienelactone hydrolase family protein [Hymenobacteraceae bacterium]
MAPLQKIEFILTPPHGRSFSADASFVATGTPKPVVVFIHGFKGFKDWGHFNLISEYFAEKGFVFVKLNLSHNGVTVYGTDLTDMQAFGNNNFCIELDDVGTLLDALEQNNTPIPTAEMDLQRLYIIGHSRGGGLAILKAAEDDRVKALATWAAISEIGYKWPDFDLDQWKRDGVQWVPNDRLKINMPLYYQLVENFEQNRDRLDIPNAACNLRIPFMIIHGEHDETLPLDMAHHLKQCKPDAEL